MSTAALITGSAKRVGRSMALFLAKQGYDIAIHCNNSTQEAEELAQDIRKLGQKVDVFVCDLGQTQQLAPLINSVAQLFPKLELLVNNASIFQRQRFLESSADDLAQQMLINATAPIMLSQAFAKQLPHGHIINMLDTDVVKTHGSHFFYLLSKKTLAEFTRMAARELGPTFRVNGIGVGSVLPSPQNPDDHDEKLAARLPLGELATVDDIIHALDYLINVPHVTGQILFTDSGQHLL